MKFHALFPEIECPQKNFCHIPTDRLTDKLTDSQKKHFVKTSFMKPLSPKMCKFVEDRDSIIFTNPILFLKIKGSEKKTFLKDQCCIVKFVCIIITFENIKKELINFITTHNGFIMNNEIHNIVD